MKKDKKKEEKDVVFEGCENVAKTNIVLKTIVGILAFVIVVSSCFGAGYLGAQLGNKDNDNKENKEDVENEELTIDSEIVKELFITFSEVNEEEYDSKNHMLDGVYDVNRGRDLTDENERKTIVWEALERNDKVTEKKCSELEKDIIDETFFCLGYNLLDLPYDDDDIDYNKLREQNKNAKTYVIDTKIYKEKYLELFGENVEFIDESFELYNYPFGYAYYDKTNNVYAVFVGISGGEAIGATQILDNIEVKDNNLKLNTTLILDETDTYTIVYTFKLEEKTGNYIFVSKDKKEKVNEDNKLSLDATAVNSDLSLFFYGTLNYYGFISNNQSNSIDLYNNRLAKLRMVASNLDANDNYYKDSELYYISYNVFKNKYIEIFGNSDSLDSDLAGLDDSNSSIFKHENNILYLGGYQTSYAGSSFILEKSFYDETDKVNVISGKYVEYQDEEYGDGSSITGTFELKYKENNNKNYLVGFKITK